MAIEDMRGLTKACKNTGVKFEGESGLIVRDYRSQTNFAFKSDDTDKDTILITLDHVKLKKIVLNRNVMATILKVLPSGQVKVKYFDGETAWLHEDELTRSREVEVSSDSDSTIGSHTSIECQTTHQDSSLDEARRFEKPRE